MSQHIEPVQTELDRLTDRARKGLTMRVMATELTERPQWVCWHYVQRDGQAKPTKVPISPNTGDAASTTDPSTWGSYQDATRCFTKSREVAGIGFVFTDDDPYLGIDLDNALGDDGAMTPLAADLVKRLNSFTEYSVSGKGLHIIVKGTLPDGRGRKNTQSGVELYCRSRYFVMTGNHVEGTPTSIEERQAAIDSLLPELFPETSSALIKQPPVGKGNDLPNEELLTKARTGANGEHFQMLWEGRWRDAGYPSQSEADLALCSTLAFWSNRDRERVDALFRQSGLMRAKWDRADYRASTLDRAMANSNGYTGARGLTDNPFPRLKWPAGSMSSPATGESVPVATGLAQAGGMEPTLPEQQVQTMTPAGLKAVELAKLTTQHGPLVMETKHGLAANQNCLAAKYNAEHRIIYEPEEKEFYAYDEKRGLWVKQYEASIKKELAADIKQLADSLHQEVLTMRCTDAFLTGIARLLRGHAEKSNPFSGGKDVLHLKNGMLDLRVTPPQLKPFSPEYYSRNQSPITYDPEARCPRFIQGLLEPVLSHEDIDLIQRWAGMALIGKNIAQRLLILTGPGASGKGTFANVIEAVIGPENVAELRTEFLGDRFESSGFIGRTLLTGKDVPGHFLNDRGAHEIKKLTGNDGMAVELKGAGRKQIRGNFNILICTNTRLQVKLDGDASAWRRRLLIVEYGTRPEKIKKVPEFDRWLIENEASGILNWMIEGAVKLLRELEQSGEFVLTPRQNSRIESLISESDGLREFVQARIVPSENCDVSVDEITRAYTEYCETRGWKPLSLRQVGYQLNDVMSNIHRATKRNDIQREGKAVRGFAGFKIAPEDGET